MKKVLPVLVALLLFPLHLLAQPMAQRVPADAMIYAGWQGTDKLQPQYQGSHLQAVLQQSTLPQFVQKDLPKLLQQMGPAPGEVETVVQVLSTAGSMAKYPTALYVGTIDFSGPLPDPRIALLCDAGAQAEALTAQIDKMLAPVRQGAPFPVEVKRQDACVMLLLGTIPEEQVNLLAGKAAGAALAAAKEFQAAMTQVQKDPALVVYVNVPAILKNADAAMAKAPESVRGQWNQIKTALNLGGLGTAVYAAGFDGKDWLEQGYLGATGPRTGVLALLESKPLSPAALKTIPASATYAIAANVDLNRLYGEMMTILNADNAGLRQAKRELDRALEEMRRKTGLDLQKDFLAPLGSEWAFYTAPGVGGNSPFGLAVVNAANDAATLEKSFAALRSKTKPKRTAEEEEEEQAMRSFGPDFSIRHADVGGVGVDYINLFIVAPAWAVKNGHAFGALQVQTIPSAADQLAAGSSLADAPGYQALLQRLAVKNPCMVQYIDLPHLAPDGYPNLVQLMTVINSAAGGKVPPSILPPLSRLMPHLAPMGSAAWTDDAGWHCKGVSPFPGMILLAGQQMGTMSSGMYPAIWMVMMRSMSSGPRPVSHVTMDMAKLRTMTQSCIVYATDKGQFPDDLAQLVNADFSGLTPRDFVVPSSGTRPLVLTDEQQKAAQKDWHSIAKDFAAHCDYVYLGKGMKETGAADVPPSEIVLIYTKPAASPQQGGFNVALADGHVEFVRGPQIKAKFEATNKARKALKLPEIQLDEEGMPIAPAAPAAATEEKAK